MVNVYYYQSFVVALFITELVTIIVYFTSVWVRSGYEGKDKQLDLIETGAYYKHVIGFLFILVVTGMTFLPPIAGYAFPDAAWLFMGGIFAGILGTELYLDVRKSFIKTGKFNEKDDEKQQ